MTLVVGRDRKASKKKQTDRPTNKRTNEHTFYLQLNSWINEIVLKVRRCNEIS